MARSKSKKGLFIGVAVALFGGLFAVARFQGNTVPIEERRVERLPEHQEPPVTRVERKPTAEPSSEKEATRKVESVHVEYVAEDYRVTKSQVDVPKGQDPYLVAVNTSLAHNPDIPADGKAIAAKVEGKTLVLDFGPSFERTYGSAEEGEILKSITGALEQFKELTHVQITVGGKPIETLGNVELTDPLPIRE